jgi:hypothetical protein
VFHWQIFGCQHQFGNTLKELLEYSRMISHCFFWLLVVDWISICPWYFLPLTWTQLKSSGKGYKWVHCLDKVEMKLTCIQKHMADVWLHVHLRTRTYLIKMWNTRCLFTDHIFVKVCFLYLLHFSLNAETSWMCNQN